MGKVETARLEGRAGQPKEQGFFSTIGGLERFPD
jgi:hypothetical protein